MSTVTVRLADFGISFATRDRARDVGKTFRGMLVPGDHQLVLDFGGVRALSYSFADELISEIGSALHQAKHSASATLINCSPELISVFQATMERQNRLGAYQMKAASARNGLAISAD